MLRTGQTLFASRLQRLQEQLKAASADFEQARSVLTDTLDLTRDCHGAHLQANDHTRRLFNQAFLSNVYIDEDGETRERSGREDLNKPFDHLLSRLVPA